MTSHALRHLQRIDHLIRIKGTGSASELADKLGISRRNVYYYLDLMKGYGAPIKFCHSRQSFYYDEDGTFLIHITFKKEQQQLHQKTL